MSRFKDQTELDILQREYRNMEVNRRAFAEETTLILRKQKQTLEKLRKENETLKDDFTSLQARTTLKPISTFEQKQMDNLVLEIEKYTKLTSNERARISSMEAEITKLRNDIWQRRRYMGGTHAASDNQRVVEKQVKILENRLDQALVRFNKSLAQNKNLRQEIDNLRCERSAFENMYKKLEKTLQEKKRQMAQIIEQSNLAYEQRDRAQLEILTIDQSNKREIEYFDQLMSELGKKLEDEIKAASQKRRLPPPGSEPEEDDSNAAMDRKAAQEIALSKEKEGLIQEQRRGKIQNFEEAFRKIATATGIHDIDELVKVFVANEEQNFSLFSYANEQANEIEKLNDQIKSLKDEESRHTKENGSSVSECKQVLQDIEIKINVADTFVDSHEQKINQSQRALDTLKDAIKMLLTRLEMDHEMTETVSITDTNVLQFLGLIEERTNEILSKYQGCFARDIKILGQCGVSQLPSEIAEAENEISNSFSGINQENSNEKYLMPSVLGVGPEVPIGGGDQIYVNPPRLTDYSSDDNSLDEVEGSESVYFRPFTRDELKNKAVDRINQQRKNRAFVKLGEHSKTGSHATNRRMTNDTDSSSAFRRRSTIHTDETGPTSHTFSRRSSVILENIYGGNSKG